MRPSLESLVEAINRESLTLQSIDKLISDPYDVHHHVIRAGQLPVQDIYESIQRNKRQRLNDMTDGAPSTAINEVSAAADNKQTRKAGDDICSSLDYTTMMSVATDFARY